MGDTKIFAHRGANAFRTENTMAAFRLAVEQGADGIELDVQLTRDGVLVVLHDETVDRVWDGNGTVKDFTYPQLRELRAREQTGGKRAYIPTLEEVLKFCSALPIMLNIELKTNIEPYPGIEKMVVDLVHQYNMTEFVLYSSFNHMSLVTLKQYDSGARIGLLYSDILVRPWDYANAVGADAIHPNINSMRIQNLVRDCHQHGIHVNVWTVDEPERMHYCLDQGVDGIITNKPDAAVYQRKNR